MLASKSSQLWAAEREALNVNIIRFLCVALILSLITSAATVWVYQFKAPKTIYIDRWFVKNPETGIMEQYALLEDISLKEGDAKILSDVMNYVIFREHYNFFPLQWAADRTFATSSPEVADEYEIEANANLAKFGKTATAKIHLESIVQTNDWTVNVRFTKTVKTKTGREETTHNLAIVTFEYQSTGKLKLNEQIENLLGFQVTSYLVVPQDVKP